jgi:hypothetical protein
MLALRFSKYKLCFTPKWEKQESKTAATSQGHALRADFSTVGSGDWGLPCFDAGTKTAALKIGTLPDLARWLGILPRRKDEIGSAPWLSY